MVPLVMALSPVSTAIATAAANPSVSRLRSSPRPWKTSGNKMAMDICLKFDVLILCIDHKAPRVHHHAGPGEGVRRARLDHFGVGVNVQFIGEDVYGVIIPRKGA